MSNAALKKWCADILVSHVSIALAQDFPELTFVVQDKYDEFLSERKTHSTPQLDIY